MARDADGSSASALLFLDFDGVVCNSEAECFASSWIAWHTHFSPPVPDRVTLRLRSRFRALRPLISSGEDYMLIQQLIATEQPDATFLAEQGAFDAARVAAGAERMSAFKTSLADTRAQFLADRKHEWLRLNPLYPHVRTLLLGASDLSRVRILSTKAAALIAEILDEAGIRLPSSSIIHAASRPGGRDARKLKLIESELEGSDYDSALFVEDQFEHLTGPCRYPVQRLLCDWGYALPSLLADDELLASHSVQRVAAAELADLVKSLTD